MAVIFGSKYRNCLGICNYQANAIVGTSSVIQTINTTDCKLKGKGMFLVNIPNAGGTTALPVSLQAVSCCGTSQAYSLYSPITGSVVETTDLVSGSTYFVTYDAFSGKFFVQGVS